MQLKSAPEKAEIALKIAASKSPVVIDVETSGLSWNRNFPIGWVLTDENTSVYVPIRHGGGGNLPGGYAPVDPDQKFEGHPWETELAKVLAQRSNLLIGHHIKFDAQMGWTAGVMFGRNMTCTMNTEALLDEYSKTFSLDGLARKYHVEAKKGEELYSHIAAMTGCKPDRKSMANYWMLPGSDPLAIEYAEGDGVSTLQLYHKQLQRVEKENLQQVWDLENRLIWSLVRMERQGLAIDNEYLDKLKAHVDSNVELAANKLPEDFNPSSGPQVSRYISEFRTDWPTTEKGNPSFTEKWLGSFPEGQLIVDLRKWKNLQNSFITPLHGHQFEGRVHPQIHQLRSEGFGSIARTSCSAPNLQQVPKHNKPIAVPFRRAFVADPDTWLYEADFSQCEPRLFAHYAEAPALVDGYNSTPFRDVHTVVADLFNADRNTTAKRMNMGMFTGLGKSSFADHMGLPFNEAAAMYDKWFQEFPEIRRFQNLAKQVMLKRGHVRTLLGRRSRLESHRFAYKATSRIIQGGNADIMKWKIVECDEYLESVRDRSRLTMTVHDSLMWVSPKTPEGDEDAQMLQKIMADVQGEPFKLIVPFAVDAARGDNWAEASFDPEAIKKWGIL